MDNIPAVRYLKAYTPDDPPPIRDWTNRPGGPVYPNLSMWADVPPDDLIVLGQHVVGCKDADD